MLKIFSLATILVTVLAGGIVMSSSFEGYDVTPTPTPVNDTPHYSLKDMGADKVVYPTKAPTQIYYPTATPAPTIEPVQFEAGLSDEERAAIQAQLDYDLEQIRGIADIWEQSDKKTVQYYSDNMNNTVQDAQDFQLNDTPEIDPNDYANNPYPLESNPTPTPLCIPNTGQSGAGYTGSAPLCD